MDPYKINIETYDRIAQTYQDKFMDMDLYDDTYDLFCKLVEKPGAAIFETGCGPGNITRYILSKRPDYRVLATDMAPNMVRLARQNNPSAVVEVMDCRNIDRMGQVFDGIVNGFCMPYLSKEDCAKFIADSAALLHPGGILYFSAIEGDCARSGYQTGKGGTIYLYYHEADFMQRELEKNHFETVSLVRKKYPMPDGSDSVHMIFIAKLQA